MRKDDPLKIHTLPTRLIQSHKGGSNHIILCDSVLIVRMMRQHCENPIPFDHSFSL